MKRAPLLMLSLLTIGVTACGMPVIKKQSFDFKSTALFKQPCDQLLPEESPAPSPPPAGAPPRVEVKLNECNSRHMARMVENFMKIQEADADRGIAGDTIDDVRRKGFTIFLDPEGKRRRENTRALYGIDALASVGMGVSPPPLQRPEDIKAYTDFMAQHYAEEYYERDMAVVADRFCLNERDTAEFGDERTFAILWRQGRVFKRIIKGGPVNNPKQERGFLICPGTFITDTITGGVSTATRAMSPIK